MTYQLLFVCLGNICRSPSAENIMNHLIEQRGLSDSIRCDSAGTSSYHIGAPPDERMRMAAAKRGIRLQGQARQFNITDFGKFDLILAMDRENYFDIMALARSQQDKNKVRLMCDYASHYPDQEVPDPYYGGESGFNYVIDLLLDACEGLLNDLSDAQTQGE
ncbi:low molecular weight phosphotyrosine protein phosphatase [Spirulina sp. CS-785/01]|uniref:low molecular weight protein-tyrosine-phosphatase n=1 Tax=Spirulina sp. CS-785/01 TaxID=3021716 RepID=UPI0023308B77|nr:low molecular weight protein-tyrosine-phosphatase [Spirulina sp. CS-785/01]MDB9314537.1 low molecular weight phosphotyrosine protein phosphatase [Spirulina sp. CS-785/01]